MKTVVSLLAFATFVLSALPAVAQPSSDSTAPSPSPVPPPPPSAPSVDPSHETSPQETAIGTRDWTTFANADRSAALGPPRHDFLRVNAGVKIGYVSSRGFDTFSSNDVLPQFSVDGTYPLLSSGSFVLGAGLGWDFGGSSGKVRGFESGVSAHKFYVPIEGRYHLGSRVYGFGKVSPGAVAMFASVEPTASNSLSATGWAFSADASIGTSILLGPRSHFEKRELRFWATPEVGYAYTTNAPLSAGVGRNDEDVLGNDKSTTLRALALSGFFWRASISATF